MYLRENFGELRRVKRKHGFKRKTAPLPGPSFCFNAARRQAPRDSFSCTASLSPTMREDMEFVPEKREKRSEKSKSTPTKTPRSAKADESAVVAGGAEASNPDEKSTKNKSHKKQSSTSSNEAPSSDIKRKTPRKTQLTESDAAQKSALANGDDAPTEKRSRKSAGASTSSRSAVSAAAGDSGSKEFVPSRCFVLSLFPFFFWA